MVTKGDETGTKQTNKTKLQAGMPKNFRKEEVGTLRFITHQGEAIAALKFFMIEEPKPRGFLLNYLRWRIENKQGGVIHSRRKMRISRKWSEAFKKTMPMHRMKSAFSSVAMQNAVSQPVPRDSIDECALHWSLKDQFS